MNRGLGGYIAKRLGFAGLMLAGVSVILFALMRLAPGGPEAVLIGGEFSQEIAAQVRQRLGLDRPLPAQYASWVLAALKGDLGRSFKTGDPVLTLILDRLGPTLQLTGGALLLALAVAVPLGVLAAVRRDSIWDTLASGVSLFGVSFPSFWLGIMLILAVALRTGWFPPSGYASVWEDPGLALRTTALPAFTLGVGLAAPLSRFLRSGMLDVLSAEYIRTARAKGLGERAVVVRHALKNALLPVVTVLALQIGTLVGGTFVIEQVFAWPGIGRLSLTANQHRDYAIIQAVVLLVAAAFVLINFAVDVLYVWLDPRIRLEAER
jgi:peptide/nickel transport system permease protein